MKKLILILGFIGIIGMLNPASAQISVNININLDKQPAWGPTGYDYAGYYYFPDINIYFDVANSLFYYLSGGKWISNAYLPDSYRKYDLYSLYKVVLNDNQPWLQNKTHKKSYSQYKGDKTQEPIRYSNNSKYDTSKNNNRSWVNSSNQNNKNNQNNNQQPANQNDKNSKNQGNNTQNKPSREGDRNR